MNLSKRALRFFLCMYPLRFYSWISNQAGDRRGRPETRGKMDTNFLHDALRNWQERNHDARGFGDLTPAEQSEIMRDAQDLKRNAPPITIDEIVGRLEKSTWFRRSR